MYYHGGGTLNKTHGPRAVLFQEEGAVQDVQEDLDFRQEVRQGCLSQERGFCAGCQRHRRPDDAALRRDTGQANSVGWLVVRPA